MKVLISDRSKWLKKVEKEIAEIEAKRKSLLEKVEVEITKRKSTFFGRLLFDDSDYRWARFYANHYADNRFDILQNIKRGLVSEDTGDVYFDEKELAVAEGES